MKDSFNIIKRQIFQLSVPAGADNFRLQQRVSEHAKGKLLTQLQSLFDELVGEDDTLIIDRIEIDLGSLELAEIESGEWTLELIARLKEQLSKLLTATVTDEGTKRESKALAHFTQWIQYMQTGFLPWNAAATDQAWHQHVLQILATDIKSISGLRQLILLGGAPVERILWQHNTTFLTSLVETLTAENQTGLPSLLEELHGMLLEDPAHDVTTPATGNADKKTFLHQVWRQVLTDAARSGAHTTLLRLAKEVVLQLRIEPLSIQKMIADPATSAQLKTFLETLPAAFRQPAQGMPRQPAEQKSEQERGQQQTPQLPGERTLRHEAGEKVVPESRKPVEPGSAPLQSPLSGRENSPPPSANSGPTSEPAADVTPMAKSTAFGDPDQPSAEASDPIAGSQAPPAPGAPPDKTPVVIATGVEMSRDFDPASSIDEEGIFVQHAGLVLLHPFLATIFRRLELVVGDHFVDAAARERALHLLHYMATGEKYPDEHLLVVAKVLCYHPIHLPVEKELELSDNETGEADHLLQVAIDRWEILKATSPDGLREGFLQRKGRLFLKNDLVHLQVESSSIDLLLDHLPWSIGIIKLPWMKDLMRVEWR